LPFDEPWVYALIVVAAVITCLLVFYVVRRRGKKAEKPKEKETPKVDFQGLPFKVYKTVRQEDASKAKEELRILGLEREILSDAIRKLYEAQAEGKITEEERERLGQIYKSRIMTVKDAIANDESVVALQELEAMQEDLVKLFSERFDEISTKVEELRSKVEPETVKEAAIPQAEAQAPSAEEKATAEEKTKKKRRPPAPKPTPRTEAEKRIEEIRAEVEKVLDRLGQMEIET
jgi:chemotaxis protein histidine kinase CheA